MEREPAAIGDSFERDGKVWKIAALVGEGDVLAYVEAKAAKVAAAPVCFLSPVHKSDVNQNSRKKMGLRTK